MLCGKETLVVNEKPFDQKEIAQFSKDVLKGKFFVFGQFSIEVPEGLYDKLANWCYIQVITKVQNLD